MEKTSMRRASNGSSAPSIENSLFLTNIWKLKIFERLLSSGIGSTSENEIDLTKIGISLCSNVWSHNRGSTENVATELINKMDTRNVATELINKMDTMVNQKSKGPSPEIDDTILLVESNLAVPISALRRSRRQSNSQKGVSIDMSELVQQISQARDNSDTDAHLLITPRLYSNFGNFPLLSGDICVETIPHQPFTIIVHPQVSLLCDIHAHLSQSEVIGFLAGRWEYSSSILYIQCAVPCTAVGRDDGGRTDVELDPLSALAASESIAHMNLVVVGWYHSHPRFCPNPSITDIHNQQQYQQLWRDTSSTSEPFVGLIVSTFDKNVTDLKAKHQWFHVKKYDQDKSVQDNTNENGHDRPPLKRVEKSSDPVYYPMTLTVIDTALVTECDEIAPSLVYPDVSTQTRIEQALMAMVLEDAQPTGITDDSPVTVVPGNENESAAALAFTSGANDSHTDEDKLSSQPLGKPKVEPVFDDPGALAEAPTANPAPMLPVAGAPVILLPPPHSTRPVRATRPNCFLREFEAALTPTKPKPKSSQRMKSNPPVPQSQPVQVLVAAVGDPNRRKSARRVKRPRESDSLLEAEEPGKGERGGVREEEVKVENVMRVTSATPSDPTPPPDMPPDSAHDPVILLTFLQSSSEAARRARSLLVSVPVYLRCVSLAVVGLAYYYRMSPHRTHLGENWRGGSKVDKMRASAAVWARRLVGTDEDCDRLVGHLIDVILLCWKLPRSVC